MNIDPLSLEARSLIYNRRCLPYSPKLKERAKILRKNMTKAERKLWFDFLKNQTIKFRRQQIIDHFIVDFYSPEKKLVIEVDGEQHYEENGLEYDKARTKILKVYSIDVIRYNNNDILNHFMEVCVDINKYLRV